MKKIGKYSREEALVLLAGDEKVAYEVFKELYEEYAESIYIAARQFLKSSELAKDLVQEIFTSIWLRRTQLDGVSNLESYLFGIAKNMACDLIKKTLKAELARQEFTARMEGNNANGTERYERHLEEIVEQLPSKRKQIFRMAKIEGLKYEVIAERLKISIHTVNHNITEALKFINERKRDAITVIFLAVAVVERLLNG
jgi:RNA polymerase sigma-70 factor (family 1)